MDETQSSIGPTASFEPEIRNQQSNAVGKPSTSVVGVYERRQPARITSRLLPLGLIAVVVILVFLIVGRVLF